MSEIEKPKKRRMAKYVKAAQYLGIPVGTLRAWALPQLTREMRMVTTNKTLDGDAAGGDTGGDAGRIAPPTAIWVCAACGKTSRDRYGDGTSGWDESCALHAILCHEASVERHPDGRVKYAQAVKGTP